MDLDAKPQVLVVDDDPLQLSALTEILEPRFDVIAVDGPAEAERRLGKIHEVAVILTDQVMPGGTGTDLLHRARERSRATRLLMTGYDDLEALARAINDGLAHHSPTRQTGDSTVRPRPTKALLSSFFKGPLLRGR